MQDRSTWFACEEPFITLFSPAMSSVCSHLKAFCMSPINVFSVPQSIRTQRGTPIPSNKNSNNEYSNNILVIKQEKQESYNIKLWYRYFKKINWEFWLHGKHMEEKEVFGCKTLALFKKTSTPFLYLSGACATHIHGTLTKVSYQFIFVSHCVGVSVSFCTELHAEYF